AAMETQALQSYLFPHRSVHFVSTVDPTHMRETLASADPATTLFIIASKSFGTLETHQNARLARSWYLDNGGEESRVDRHFVAVSANVPKAVAFGIHPDDIFPRDRKS